MFGRVLGLDGRESYRELRRERLCCPHRPAEKLLHMSERIHGEKTASELQDPLKPERQLPAVAPILTWVRLARRIPVCVHIDETPPSVVLAAGITAAVEI